MKITNALGYVKIARKEKNNMEAIKQVSEKELHKVQKRIAQVFKYLNTDHIYSFLNLSPTSWQIMVSTTISFTSI